MKLSDIKGGCKIEGDCWLWNGATSDGYPRIWAPDYTLHNGKKRSQVGRRAVWHVKHCEAIPNGWRVFGTCEEPLCLNPAHMDCAPQAEIGKRIAESGKWKNNIKRILANRKTGRERSHFTPETFELATTSSETGVALSRETGVTRQAISKARNGHMRAFLPVGGIFTQLIASNDNARKAA
jgi:hypothetical protein